MHQKHFGARTLADRRVQAAEGMSALSEQHVGRRLRGLPRFEGALEERLGLPVFAAAGVERSEVVPAVRQREVILRKCRFVNLDRPLEELLGLRFSAASR